MRSPPRRRHRPVTSPSAIALGRWSISSHRRKTMSATSARRGREQDFDSSSSRSHGVVRRLTTETKAAFKTTEFFAMIAVIVGILIAAASIGASEGHPDKFIGSQAWLYVAIVASAYMISRGLAKSGSREPYDDERS